MSYSADIGREGKTCMMTGVGSADISAALQQAVDLAHDPNGYAHYPVITIIVHECCDVCRSSGRIWTGKRVRREHVCKACNGRASWPVLTLTVRNPA